MHNYNFSEFSMKSNYNWPHLIGCPSAYSRVNVMANNLRQLNAHFVSVSRVWKGMWVFVSVFVSGCLIYCSISLTTFA